MSEPKVKMDLAEAAEWLNVNPGDLANYALALFFLDLHKQGTFALKPEEKAEFEAIAKELEPKIEPAVEKAKEKYEIREKPEAEKIEFEKVTVKLPKRVMDYLHAMEKLYGRSAVEMLEYDIVEALRCELEGMTGETIIKMFNLEPVFKAVLTDC